MIDATPFFAFARERYNIFLKRQSGDPRPWTTDRILNTCRFTNVFREDDKTTVWFRNKIRDPLKDKPEVLLATVLFRWFNRISTGEALFLQPCLPPGPGEEGDTAFEEFLVEGNIAALKHSIKQYCGDGPYVTGAFIINTPTGMTKLDGVLWAFGEFARESDWREMANLLLESADHQSLQNIWEWLRQFPRLGDFMSYEVVTDLRHTALLNKAPDIATWANPGPGAKRGLCYLMGGGRKEVPEAVRSREGQIELMRIILESSLIKEHWPHNWPLWEMREVEHTLCEYAKYEMVKRGEGRTKGMYP